ncbi:transcriptional regulator, ArsR family [Propionibacteriaceae bacterium ES.041]|uniref:ArsR/SmtB family transcription factor n=1 Tax=Enemella evansiae TaxID=2016499 RepID=UPI000B96FFBE|nr:metalloregulator ArsR/SmtB family transcription factor [Enemella evansiae]OYN96157.1 transcriptional regulator [Enemella evansiae]PFG65379.1 transcriptional regulator, ArsR family [Propionibacteriaceae bacterium ES.041]
MTDVYAAIADPNRRLLLDELARRDAQPLFELCARLTTVHGVSLSRQAVSQHLAVLEEAGLVTTRREGRTKLHSFNPDPLREITDRWPRTRPQPAEE